MFCKAVQELCEKCRQTNSITPCEQQDLRGFGLDKYAVRALRKNGIETLDDLLSLSWKQFWALPGVNYLTARKVSLCLAEIGKDLKMPRHVLGTCKEDPLAHALLLHIPGLEYRKWNAFHDRKQNPKFSNSTCDHVSGLKALSEQELCRLIGYWNLEKAKVAFNRMGLDLNLKQEDDNEKNFPHGSIEDRFTICKENRTSATDN